MIAATTCPLCTGSAGCRTLSGGNGYLYDCITCGGMYEIGTNALARAERGELHPDVIHGVRQLLAAGRRPRVEWDGPNSCFKVQTA